MGLGIPPGLTFGSFVEKADSSICGRALDAGQIHPTKREQDSRKTRKPGQFQKHIIVNRVQSDSCTGPTSEHLYEKPTK